MGKWTKARNRQFQEETQKQISMCKKLCNLTGNQENATEATVRYISQPSCSKTQYHMTPGDREDVRKYALLLLVGL